jgi:hypothetical protein
MTARVDEANNRLRHEVHDLEERVAELEAERAELQLKLMRARGETGGTVDGGSIERRGLPDALPVAQAVEIDRSAHARDDDGDGRIDRVYVPIEPRDGRGRFVQTAAWARVSVETIPPAGEGEPRTLGWVELDPQALRDAFRSGLTGAHYTVWVSIEAGAVDVEPTTAEGERRTLLVRVRLDDQLTGATLRAERLVGLRAMVD